MERWKIEIGHTLNGEWEVIDTRWDEEKIIRFETYEWVKLDVPLEDLTIVYGPYWQNKPPMLVRKSDFVDGVLQINNDHPLKWFYDRVENDDE